MAARLDRIEHCLDSLDKMVSLKTFLRGPKQQALSLTVAFSLLSLLIIKITISSLVIGLKKSFFPLIRSPSCYRTVCQWTVCYRTLSLSHSKMQFKSTNHIQSCHYMCVRACSVVFFVIAGLRFLCQYFNANFPSFNNLASFLFLGNCNFYD